MKPFEELAKMAPRGHEVTQWKLPLVMETFPVLGESLNFAHEVCSFRFTREGQVHLGFPKGIP